MTNASHDSETLAEGQQVFTACAFIWHEFDGIKKVFLPKRADTKKFLPGIYELPGGHIDFGEDLKLGLAREIMEEFGMRSTIGDVADVFTYMNDIKKSHSIEVVYFAQFADPIEQIHLNPEDHSKYGWFAENELDTVYAGEKGIDDPEALIVKKGFAKLGR
jgi:8-oxo-dGTP diphosphatase